MRVTLCVAFAVVTIAASPPAAAQRAAIPGWSIQKQDGLVVQTSPRGASQNPISYLQYPPEEYSGSFSRHFAASIGQLAQSMTVEENSGITTEEWPLPGGKTRTLWKVALLTTNEQAARVKVQVFAYRVDQNRAQTFTVIQDARLPSDDPQLAAVLDNIADHWKAGRSPRYEDVTPQPPPPSPVPSPPTNPQASSGTAAPCVPTPVTVNYPRTVSRQQCGFVGGRSNCVMVYDTISMPVTTYTGCP